MTPAALVAAVLAASWVAAGFAIAVGIGRSVRIADDDHDIWGCDGCEQEAAEIAAEEAVAESMMRHPSSRKAREVAELESWWAAS